MAGSLEEAAEKTVVPESVGEESPLLLGFQRD
jgi:hypothetical protein